MLLIRQIFANDMITPPTSGKVRWNCSTGKDNLIVESSQQITTQFKNLNRNLLTSILVHIETFDAKETSRAIVERESIYGNENEEVYRPMNLAKRKLSNKIEFKIQLIVKYHP